MRSPAVAADGLRCLSVLRPRARPRAGVCPGLCHSFRACPPCLDQDISLPKDQLIFRAESLQFRISTTAVCLKLMQELRKGLFK
ncbi:hypothetical protein DV515_00003514, partial [Chloebia gouldiae]